MLGMQIDYMFTARVTHHLALQDLFVPLPDPTVWIDTIEGVTGLAILSRVDCIILFTSWVLAGWMDNNEVKTWGRVSWLSLCFWFQLRLCLQSI